MPKKPILGVKFCSPSMLYIYTLSKIIVLSQLLSGRWNEKQVLASLTVDILNNKCTSQCIITKMNVKIK